MTELVPLRSNKLALNGDGVLTLQTPEGTEFEFTAEYLSQFQDSNGNWLEEGWPTVDAIFVCRTEDCEIKDREVRITLTKNVDGIFRSICGLCQKTPDLYEIP